jgi:hypothetical protein
MYKREESFALAREQELHIEAATRQLETLAKLELKETNSSFQVDENHIAKTEAPNDAGRGSVVQEPLAQVRSTSFSQGRTSFASQSPSSVSPSGHRLGSTGALSLGLSSELRRILNMSTLDAEISLLDGGDSADEDYERRAERQYMWLRRYHQHLADQSREVQAMSVDGGQESRQHFNHNTKAGSQSTMV